MHKYNSIAEFVDNYDAFILDIWGVIHDGQKTYPGVLECLQHLKKAGKEIIFVSNAPRRAFKVKAVLAKFGIDENLYKDAISSGELAFQYFSIFSSQSNFVDSNLGKYFYIGPPKDTDLLDGLNYQMVEKANDANFALVTGFDHDDSTILEKAPQLNEALNVGLKLYCVNPDMIVIRQDGSKALCAGVMGEFYANQGGKVEYIGKPWPAIYEYAFKKFGASTKKICAIGDSLTTDIRGANNVGIDSILVLGGILFNETEPLETLLKKANVTPTGIIEKFNW